MDASRSTRKASAWKSLAIGIQEIFFASFLLPKFVPIEPRTSNSAEDHPLLHRVRNAINPCMFVNTNFYFYRIDLSLSLSLKVGGPAWLGNLHDGAFIKQVMDTAATMPHPLKTLPRIQGMLSVAQEVWCRYVFSRQAHFKV